MDDIKQKLVAKLQDRTCDMDNEELLSLFSLDIDQLIQDAIEIKVQVMSIDQLLELL